MEEYTSRVAQSVNQVCTGGNFIYIGGGGEGGKIDEYIYISICS